MIRPSLPCSIPPSPGPAGLTWAWEETWRIRKACSSKIKALHLTAGSIQAMTTCSSAKHQQKQIYIVESHKESFTWSEPELSWSGWLTQKRRHLTTGKFYQQPVKRLLGMEYLSRILLNISLCASPFHTCPKLLRHRCLYSHSPH